MPPISLLGVAEARPVEGKPAAQPAGDGGLFNDALTSALDGHRAPDGQALGTPVSAATMALQRGAAALATRVSQRGSGAEGSHGAGGEPGTGVRGGAAGSGSTRVPGARDSLASVTALVRHEPDDENAAPAVGRHLSGDRIPASTFGNGTPPAVTDASREIDGGRSDAPFGEVVVEPAGIEIPFATAQSGGAESRTVSPPAVSGPQLATVIGTDPELVAAFVPAVPGSPAAVEVYSSGSGSAPAMREALHPEFRDRLERVIERMGSEFGYRVEVVATVRSQERQDALFRQGRATPGPVVTWTRSSRHTDGLAADVMVDGTWSNPIAYDRLARIAREEGLRTLGPRDRGHVELPRTAFAEDALIPQEMPPAVPAAAQGVGRIASVARVAQVARVATVARVASPGSARQATPRVPSNEGAVVVTGEHGFGAPRERAPVVTSFAAANRPSDATAHPATAATPTVSPAARSAAAATMGSAAGAATPLHAVADTSAAPFTGSAESRYASERRGAGVAGTNEPAREVAMIPSASHAAAKADGRERLETGVKTTSGSVPGVESVELPMDVEPELKRDGLHSLRSQAVEPRLAAGARLDHGMGRDGRGEHDAPSKRERPDSEARAQAVSANERLGASLLNAFEAEPRDRGLHLGRTESVDSFGLAAADRIAQIAELRDSASERPLSSVLLRLDRPDGGEDRIRIGMRGTGVGASFEISDSGMAEDLGRHLAELARALERQGLDAETMTVRTLTGRDASTGASQAVAGERDALRAASAGATGNGTTAGGREQRGSPRQDHPNDEPARQRARRDSRGDR